MNSSIGQIFVYLFGGIFVVSMISNCPNKQRTRNSVETRTLMPGQELAEASDQFDLRVLENLLKETTDAEKFEERLNASDPKLHNLDLDENDKVDYINVNEYGSGNTRGLALSVELAPDGAESEVQEIARIDIEKESDSGGRYEVRGNQSLYGNNHYYRSSFGLTDALLMGYLFSNHRSYGSRWGHGNYPGSYRSQERQPTKQYKSQVNSRTSGSTLTKASASSLGKTAKSPMNGRNAKTVRAPLKNPTSAQKSFQARNPSKRVRSGGFGGSSAKTASTPRSTSPSIRRSAPSRSRSFSFGGK
ncbi:MAG: hypothetical protein ACI8T1_003573 [Verrucomicrobiales bacterium]|jgi:hypothetical protein